MYNKEKAKTSNFLKTNIQYCQYCGKECHNINSLKQHECRCKQNPTRINLICRIPTEKRGWAKGLTKDQDERLKNHSTSIKKFYKTHEGQFKGKHHTEETKQKISEKMKGNKYWIKSLGKTGFGKKGWYKGIHCDSTYELAYVIYCLDHNIEIKRCKKRFKYFYKDKIHNYYPDFELNNKLIEIKGYWQDQVEIKKEAVLKEGFQIEVLYPKDLKNIFDYIYQKYGLKEGKELASLYEK